jgi:capsular exopolysaccharide synthesis family protein
MMSNSDPGAFGSKTLQPVEPPPVPQSPSASSLPVVEVRHPVAARLVPPARVPPVTPNIATLLKALRRRWFLAVSVGLMVGLTTALCLLFFLPPGKHIAYFKFYMPKKPEGIIYGHPEDTADFQVYQQTQIAQMTGRMVLGNALSDPSVVALKLPELQQYINPVEWLEKQVRVTLPEGPELPRITIAGDNPAHLKVLVKAIADAYLERFAHKQLRERRDRLTHLNEVKNIAQERLKRLVKDRNEVARVIGTGESQIIVIKQEMEQKQLALAQAELLKVESELMKMHLEAKQFKVGESVQVDVPDRVIDAAIDKDIGKDFAMRGHLEAQLAETRRVLSNEDHPRIRSLIESIESQKKAMELRRKELRPSYKAEMLEKARYDAKARYEELLDKIKFYEEFKKNLEIEVANRGKAGKKLNDGALDLDNRRLDIALAEATLTRILAEIDRLTVEMPAALRVRSADELEVISPDEQKRKLMTASLGAVGGFSLVVFLVAFFEFRSQRIDSADAVEHGLGLQLIGTLPAAPKRLSRLIRSTANDAETWQSMLIESVNSVRTLLLRGARSDNPLVLVVTSATSGEGKTSVATHLAASLGRSGHKTLLLDCDLRKPAAHTVLGLPLSPGFCEALRGEVAVKDAIHATPVEGLSLMPAGSCCSEAIRLLARDRLPALLEQLKLDFPFIVIDSSPILPVADALQVSQHADGVILSVFYEFSQMPALFTAYQRLRMAGVPILGAVLNGTHESNYGYGRYNQKLIENHT